MYLMPETVEELEKALKTADENTRLCAGGTDLVIALREKKQFHYSLLDLTHMPELQTIEESEEGMKIGSAVTMDELERSAAVGKWFPALRKAASMVGSTQIRNRATIGGNVANASQSSDLTPVLMACGARAVLLNREGSRRELPVEELVIGLGKTQMEQGEVILWFLMDKRNSYSAFSKVGSRKAVTISKINACMCADTSSGVLRNVTVYLGAVGAKGKAAPFIEAALEGESLSGLPQEKIKEAVYCQIEDNIPDRSSKHYKKPAAYGLICDLIEDFQNYGKGGATE